MGTTSRSSDSSGGSRIHLVDIASGAKTAAFGMKWGYKPQLDDLETFLAADGQVGC